MSAKPTNPARIVVIEDNPADIHLLRLALNEHHSPYELEILRDGEEAIRFVEQQAVTSEPCVFVLDLHLPKQDGTAVLQAIRSKPTLAAVQVVALTSVAAPKDEHEVRELGVRLYRTKPSDLDDWIDLAGEILKICSEPTLEAVI